ncbi:hypothetical protein F4778DRAFT_769430 [Xylariomycetidae sp. FL2044]|nr:hypothetical protein F4778DRAFT_769430 [Xylariomycetidae sp. FL2044]
MASLTDTLTASGGTESAGFLNDIVSHLWPNINVAACKMVKDIVEPMLAQTLPGPLSSLHFAKLDLGPVPLHLSKVDVHKTAGGGVKLDMDADWDGKCDVELDGKMIPKMGIEHIKLHGRISVLMCPITNVIPVIGALQIAFINPPTIKLDFTDAISIADLDVIERSILKIVLDIVGGMAVLPNRYLVNMSADNDYFRTYVPHVGVVRITVEGASDIAGPKKSGVKKLLDKIARDVPDCYCKVAVGAEKAWRTKTVSNTHNPKWDETHDFLVMDHDQCILVDVQDHDVDDDDDIGIALTTVRQLLLDGGRQELDLTHRGQPTGAKLRLRAEFHNLAAQPELLTSSGSGSAGGAEKEKEGLIRGTCHVLIAGASGLAGDKEQLNPSVKVEWSGQTFTTPAKTYSPGTDIFNPAFNTPFVVPVTAAMAAEAGTFRLTLLNGKTATGTVEVPFRDVLDAPDMALEKKFDVGSGGSAVRAAFILRGMQPAQQ